MIEFLINYLCLNLAETPPINFWKLIVRKCFTHNLWVSSNRKLLLGDDLTSQFITCSFDKGQPHLTTSPSRQKTQIYYQLKKKNKTKITTIMHDMAQQAEKSATLLQSCTILLNKKKISYAIINSEPLCTKYLNRHKRSLINECNNRILLIIMSVLIFFLCKVIFASLR